jgi:hypothetical protein
MGLILVMFAGLFAFAAGVFGASFGIAYGILRRSKVAGRIVGVAGFVIGFIAGFYFFFAGFKGGGEIASTTWYGEKWEFDTFVTTALLLGMLAGMLAGLALLPALLINWLRGKASNDRDHPGFPRKDAVTDRPHD